MFLFQGPLPNTTEDFWQMIWEQEVIVIAMVTLEQEGGKVNNFTLFIIFCVKQQLKFYTQDDAIYYSVYYL